VAAVESLHYYVAVMMNVMHAYVLCRMVGWLVGWLYTRTRCMCGNGKQLTYVFVPLLI
jgi:hypothetical protein